MFPVSSGKRGASRMQAISGSTSLAITLSRWLDTAKTNGSRHQISGCRLFTRMTRNVQRLKQRKFLLRVKVGRAAFVGFTKTGVKFGSKHSQLSFPIRGVQSECVV